MVDLIQRISKLSPEQRKIFELKLKKKGIDISQIPFPERSKRTKIEDLSLSMRKKEKTRSHPLVPAEEKEYYPVSASQKRMYILNLFFEYNMRLAYQVEGNLDRNRFQEVFQKLVKRHESLRTSFELIAGEPVQKVHDRVAFEIEYHDLTNNRIDNEVNSIISQFFSGFDLSVPPLLRVGLIKLSPSSHLFLVNIQHIISDGGSMGILAREFARLYRGEELAGMRIRYRDFSTWENHLSGTEEYLEKQAYWLDKFSGKLPVLDMPFDYPRPPVQDVEGARVHFSIAGETFQALKTLALKQDTSMYMVLLALYHTLLFRWTGQEDIVIGTITAGRERWEMEPLIGVFINVIALKNHLEKSQSFQGFLRKLKQDTLTAFENQSYPFEELLNQVIKKKDPSRNPLFDVMLIFQSVNMRSRQELELLHVNLDRYEYESRHHVQQDITLWAAVQGERIRMDLDYCTALFKPEAMERFASHFLTLLREAAANPELELAKIEIISQEEKHQLLEQFNDTETAFPTRQPICQLFEQQVQQTPDHVALMGPKLNITTNTPNHTRQPGNEIAPGVHTDPSLNQVQLTYRELNETSNQLARGLLKRVPITRDNLAAIVMDRSLCMVKSIISTWKCGAAYVPIDPAYPDNRIKDIIEDSQVKLVISVSGMLRPELEKTLRPITTIIHLDQVEETLQNEDKTNLDVTISPRGLAYVIYTSGSTGKPKGVMIENTGMINHLYVKIVEIPIQPGSVIAQNSPHCFDISIWQFFASLLKGGKTIIYSNQLVLNPNVFIKQLGDNKVNILELVPSYLSTILDTTAEQKSQHLFPGLKVLLVTGETIRPALVKHWFEKFPGTKMVNAYGPTEASDDITHFHMDRFPEKENIPIGKTLANLRIYIVTNTLDLCPIGIKGEICVSGIGLGRGYLNDSEKTSAAFIKNPFGNKPGANMYRTGDIGRYLPDGNIEFFGRKDNQVKIRGYRIELKEIESEIMRHDHIKDAVVLVCSAANTYPGEDKYPHQYLCAYIVPTRGKKTPDHFDLNPPGLKKYLAGKLPGYMIPAHFIKIDEIPLTPNGKIDEKALHEYDVQENIGTGSQYVPPGNELEKNLVEIWEEILMKDRIGINDRFFDLGGQSILAMRAVAKIQQVFKVKIPLINFFQAGTIRETAEIIEKLAREYEDKPKHPTIKRKGFIQPFELEKAPLLRIKLLELENQLHFFFIDMHHIITDGISLDIVAEEFALLYQENQLEPLIIQYKDFSQWQAHFFKSNRFYQQEQYWLNIFKGEIPRLNLPLDYPRPTIRKTQGKRIQEKVGPELTSQLKKLATEHEITLFILLLAVYTILLAKTSSQEDIIVGTPVSGRFHANVTQLVGMFVNTLVLRIQPGNHFTFFDFLKTVKEQTLSALENQDYPFEMLVEKLNLSGDTSRNPIFDTIFTVQHLYHQDPEFHRRETTFIPYELEYTGSMFDLVLGAGITEHDIRLNFMYNIHLFREETIRQLARRFMNILSQIAHKPGQQIKEINTSVQFQMNTDITEPDSPSYIDANPYQDQLTETRPPIEASGPPGPLSLTRQQKEWILYEFNASGMEYPGEMTIHQLFEGQAQAVPFRTAVTCENRQLTYGELSRKSGHLAGFLKEKGIKNNSCVGLMLEKSLEMMTGILGILKAGACYLPLDHRSPPGHNRFLATDASVTVLLTQSRFQSPFLAKYVRHVIRMDDPGFYNHHDHDYEYEHEYDAGGAAVKPDQLAYVIYTSGSTGRPKGTMVQHQAVAHRLTWMQKKYPLAADDTILQKTICTFDVSVTELFDWFMGQAQLCFLAPSTENDLGKILDTIATHHITAVSFTPSVLHILFLFISKENVGKLASLKWIFCAGEQLPVNLVEMWSKLPINAKLENLYGPTEATVYASYYSCHHQANPSPIPIGKPLGNTRLYVLDKQQEPVPPGSVGELVIAGPGLARGYLNRPDLTHEKFLPDPFFPGERIYRTGDYAKLLPEGQMVYLGRMDNQVKIKGIRIELEEIEIVLLKHPHIREAAVTLIQDDKPMGNYLAAYILTQQDLTLKELRDYLRQIFPDYMVPSAFFRVKQMPLSASGKLDKKLLPQCGIPIKTTIQYTAPRTELERQLANIWTKILKLDRIGIDHNFFEIGGDSLRGNLLRVDVNNQFNTETVIKDLFDAPTIREFAKILPRVKTKKSIAITPIEKKEYYPSSSAQKRLFIIHRLNKEDTSYNTSMSMMIKGRLDKNQLQNTINQLLQRHASLRTRFDMQNGEIVQIIEDIPDFAMELLELKTPIAAFNTGNTPGKKWSPQEIEKIITGDIPTIRVRPGEPGGNLLATEKLTKIKRKPKDI